MTIKDSNGGQDGGGGERSFSGTKETMTDSGIEASNRTSAAHNSSEAQQLLDSSGTARIAADSCCCCQNCGQAGSYPPKVDQNLAQYYAMKQQQQGQLGPPKPLDPIESTSLEAQSIRLLPAYFVAELVGTFMLVLIGDGALAAYIFASRPVDSFSVCLAFGVGAMIGTYVSSSISGAHLNPAATFAYALNGKLKWALVPVYIVAQYIGGFIAALVLFLNYSEAINYIDGGEHSTVGSTNSTGQVFATYPAPFVSVWGSLIDQIVGTSVLLFSITAVGDRTNLGLEDRFQPPIVAWVIGLVCFAFSINCGAIFNPARDLSPRLLTALLGYPGVWSPIEGTYWIVAGVVGPHIGAIVGVFTYKYLISTALFASQRHVQMIRESQGVINANIAKDTRPAGRSGTDQHHRAHNQQQHNQHHHHHHHHHPPHRHNDSNIQLHTHHDSPATTPQVVQRRPDLAHHGSAIVR
uniref:Aquaporin-10 n=1 Tax=Aceria tosichella TaxID=561515 RepID=A0A6G1SEL1_9ACAR